MNRIPGILGLAASGFLAALALPAQAAENGVGFHLPGGRGPMAGYIPPPGLYVQREFDVAHRLQGIAGYVTVALPSMAMK